MSRALARDLRFALTSMFALAFALALPFTRFTLIPKNSFFDGNRRDSAHPHGGLVRIRCGHIDHMPLVVSGQRELELVDVDAHSAS